MPATECYKCGKEIVACWTVDGDSAIGAVLGLDYDETADLCDGCFDQASEQAGQPA